MSTHKTDEAIKTFQLIVSSLLTSYILQFKEAQKSCTK